jgi:hypothetical protein
MVPCTTGCVLLVLLLSLLSSARKDNCVWRKVRYTHTYYYKVTVQDASLDGGRDGRREMADGVVEDGGWRDG